MSNPTNPNKHLIECWAKREKRRDMALAPILDKIVSGLFEPNDSILEKQLDEAGYELMSPLSSDPGSITWVRKK